MKKGNGFGKFILAIFIVIGIAALVLGVCYFAVPKFKNWTNKNVFKIEAEAKDDDDLLKRLEAIQASLDAMTKERDELKVQVDVNVKNHNKVVGDLEAEKKKTETLQKSVVEYETKIEQQTAVIVEKTNIITEKETEIKTLTDEKTVVEQRVIELEGQVDEKDEELAALRRQVETLNNTISQLRSQVSDLQAEKTRLEGEVDSLQADKTRLEGELEQSQGKVTELNIQITVLNENIVNLNKQIEQLEKQLEEKTEGKQYVKDVLALATEGTNIFPLTAEYGYMCGSGQTFREDGSSFGYSGLYLINLADYSVEKINDNPCLWHFYKFKEGRYLAYDYNGWPLSIFSLEDRQLQVIDRVGELNTQYLSIETKFVLPNGNWFFAGGWSSVAFVFDISTEQILPVINNTGKDMLNSSCAFEKQHIANLGENKLFIYSESFGEEYPDPAVLIYDIEENTLTKNEETDIDNQRWNGSIQLQSFDDYLFVFGQNPNPNVFAIDATGRQIASKSDFFQESWGPYAFEKGRNVIKLSISGNEPFLFFDTTSNEFLTREEYEAKYPTITLRVSVACKARNNELCQLVMKTGENEMTMVHVGDTITENFNSTDFGMAWKNPSFRGVYYATEDISSLSKLSQLHRIGTDRTFEITQDMVKDGTVQIVLVFDADLGL